MDLVSEIKTRLSIEDFLSEYITLRPNGKNFKALSPFKNEKTPSFHVSCDKQIAWCFATNQGGDVFNMYQLLNGVEFSEALRDLAFKVGLQSEWEALKANYDPDKALKQTEKKSLLKEVHAKALNLYVKNLNQSTNKIHIDYLLQRGLKMEIIKKFKLGLSFKKGDVLSKKLIAESYVKSDLVDSGLVLSSDFSNGKIIDRFYDRIMVPIFNDLNECVAFGGRITKDDMNPKYLNSKETEIYKKNNILFAYNFAKPSILASKEVILVEGYFDVMALFNEGVENVVSISGTALCEPQVVLLKRQADKVYLALDSDEAGIKASLRSAKLLIQQDLQIRFINFGQYKDVADYLLDGNDFEELKVSSLDLVGFFKILHPRLEAENVNQISNDFFDVISSCTNELQVNEFLKLFAESYSVSFAILQKNYRNFKNKIKSKPHDLAPAKKKVQFDLEDRFWAISLIYPKVFAKISKDVYLNRSLFSKFENYQKVRDIFSGKKFNDLDLSAELKVEVLNIENRQNFADKVLEQELHDLFSSILAKSKKGRVREIKEKIKFASKSEVLDLMNELQILLKS